MNATALLDRYPLGRPLTADQITEFHVARLLLLIYICGTKEKASRGYRLDGLTKLAKLDFFVRYPDFFQRAIDHLGLPISPGRSDPVEAPMVRHHYGPWDARYYQILGYMESRDLITVERRDKAFVFVLSELGVDVAKRLSDEESFSEISLRIREVKDAFKGRSGDSLKKLVYELFDAEIAKLPLGQVIEP